jgi:ketosteroid isomerase-like protein
MQADAATRSEVLLALGELRAAIAEKRLEGALALFAPDADTTLIGSSAGEIVRGPMEMRPFLEDLFDRPETISWEWDDVSVSSCGDVAWLWTDGALVIDGRSARPYRISGVLERRQGRWLWSLFHGAEPS